MGRVSTSLYQHIKRDVQKYDEERDSVMKFVLARPHPLVKHCWLLWIDDQCLDFVAETIQRSMASVLRIEKSHPSLEHTPLTITALASAQGQILSNLKERIGWYMNCAGGCCTTVHDVVHSVEADDFPTVKLSKSDIKITQYPRGTHFYATMPNGELLIWHGTSKWNTYQGCESAVKKWISQQ